jgi:hypothetical protein
MASRRATSSILTKGPRKRAQAVRPALKGEYRGSKCRYNSVGRYTYKLGKHTDCRNDTEACQGHVGSAKCVDTPTRLWSRTAFELCTTRIQCRESSRIGSPTSGCLWIRQKAVRSSLDIRFDEAKSPPGAGSVADCSDCVSPSCDLIRCGSLHLASRRSLDTPARAGNTVSIASGRAHSA